MASELEVPSATDTPEVHADFIELAALRNTEDGISLREFVRDLGITGTADAYDRVEEGQELDVDVDDLYEGIAEAAYAELDDRCMACGGTPYPFQVDRSVLVPARDAMQSAYLFMALLSRFGKDAGPPASGGAQLFEDLCAAAAAAYLGGPVYGGHSRVFGFPRRLLPSGFTAALDQVCQEIGEGKKHRDGPTVADQKDAKLDIIAWKEFADRRPGKLIAFGQCATGEDWREKVSELPQPSNWCKLWMEEGPAVDPIRLFFVPHRVELRRWRHVNVLGGILFDRCRIAQFANGLDDDLIDRCERWCTHVIQTRGLS